MTCTYTFDDKIQILKKLNSIGIPELVEFFNLETNPYYFETISNEANEQFIQMNFKQKQKLFGQINKTFLIHFIFK